MKKFNVAVSIALAFSLVACSKEGDEDENHEVATKAVVVPPPVVVPPAPVVARKVEMPTTVAADAVTVGNAIQGDTAVKSASAQFTTADTIYASGSVQGKPAGADASVYWTYQDGTAHKQETKKLSGEQSVWFSFAKADGMKPGKYNVEIDVNMKPIGIADFQIK